MFTEEKIQTVIDAFSYEAYEKKQLFSVSPVKEFQVLILKISYNGAAVIYWPNFDPDDGADVKIDFRYLFFLEKMLIQ